jgi:hypothetical protein
MMGVLIFGSFFLLMLMSVEEEPGEPGTGVIDGTIEALMGRIDEEMRGFRERMAISRGVAASTGAGAPAAAVSRSSTGWGNSRKGPPSRPLWMILAVVTQFPSSTGNPATFRSCASSLKSQTRAGTATFSSLPEGGS